METNSGDTKTEFWKNMIEEQMRMHPEIYDKGGD
jgi:hypothetical protein